MEGRLHGTVMGKYNICETLSCGGFDVGKHVGGCNRRGSFLWCKEAMLLGTIRYEYKGLVYCL